MRVPIDLYPCSYARFPFWNPDEDIVLADGKAESCSRTGNVRALPHTHQGECDQGRNAGFRLQNGIISRSLSCNPCP